MHDFFIKKLIFIYIRKRKTYYSNKSINLPKKTIKSNYESNKIYIERNKNII